jgi:hypothetical protein
LNVMVPSTFLVVRSLFPLANSSMPDRSHGVPILPACPASYIDFGMSPRCWLMLPGMRVFVVLPLMMIFRVFPFYRFMVPGVVGMMMGPYLRSLWPIPVSSLNGRYEK